MVENSCWLHGCDQVCWVNFLIGLFSSVMAGVCCQIAQVCYSSQCINQFYSSILDFFLSFSEARLSIFDRAIEFSLSLNSSSCESYSCWLAFIFLPVYPSFSSSSLSDDSRWWMELRRFLSEEVSLEPSMRLFMSLLSFLVLQTRTAMMTMKMRKTVTLMKMRRMAGLGGGTQSLVAGVEFHVDHGGDVEVDGVVAVGADGVGEEGVVDDEGEEEVVNFLDGLVGLLRLEGVGPELAVLVVDEGAGEEVALILHGLLVAANILLAEVVEVVEVVAIRGHGAGDHSLHGDVGGDEFCVPAFQFDEGEVVRVGLDVDVSLADDEVYAAYLQHAEQTQDRPDRQYYHRNLQQGWHYNQLPCMLDLQPIGQCPQIDHSSCDEARYSSVVSSLLQAEGRMSWY